MLIRQLRGGEQCDVTTHSGLARSYNHFMIEIDRCRARGSYYRYIHVSRTTAPQKASLICPRCSSSLLTTIVRELGVLLMAQPSSTKELQQILQSRMSPKPLEWVHKYIVPYPGLVGVRGPRGTQLRVQSEVDSSFFLRPPTALRNASPHIP